MVYSSPHPTQIILERRIPMVTCVNYGVLATGSGCAISGFLSGLSCSPGRSHRASRTGPVTPTPSPTLPNITETGRRADSNRQQPIIMGLQGKVHNVVMEMHGCLPGFSGFLVASSIYLCNMQREKRKKKNRMRLFMLCARWLLPEEGLILQKQ